LIGELIDRAEWAFIRKQIMGTHDRDRKYNYFKDCVIEPIPENDSRNGIRYSTIFYKHVNDRE
jgi:hypothetical protein